MLSVHSQWKRMGWFRVRASEGALQGYELSVVAMMVEGIPAMVHCLEFIAELLLQPHLDKQLLAVTLAAELVLKYPSAPRALPIATQVVAHVTHVRNKVAGSSPFLRQALLPVARCGSAFPALAPQAVAVIQSCMHAGGSLVASAPPRDAALENAATKAFADFLHRKALKGRPTPMA